MKSKMKFYRKIKTTKEGYFIGYWGWKSYDMVYPVFCSCLVQRLTRKDAFDDIQKEIDNAKFEMTL